MVSSADLAPIILIIVFAAIIVMWRDGGRKEGMMSWAQYSDSKICPGTGERVPIMEECMKTCPGGFKVRENEDCEKTCWNGSKVAANADCPDKIIDCGGGITAIEGKTTCPQMKTCLNRTKVRADASCPMTRCSNGVMVEEGAKCPDAPVNCATVDDINQLIKKFESEKCPGPTPTPKSKWTDPTVGKMKDTKETIFKKCNDGRLVWKGGDCAKGPWLSNEGWFTIKFGPVANQMWKDAESTRLRTQFPPGTRFEFVVENNVRGVGVFDNSQTFNAYSIKLSGPAVRKIDIGMRPEFALTTTIYVTTPAKARGTPTRLTDAVGNAGELKRETIGTYPGTVFKTYNRLVASGKAFQRLQAKEKDVWMYFRPGTAAGADPSSPFFRMKRVTGTTVSKGTLPVRIQQYQAARRYWVDQQGTSPYLPLNKPFVVLELKPQWQNAGEGSVTRGQIQDGKALPANKISMRFVPQNGVVGTGATRYQNVWDENMLVMGKYYLETKKFELPGIPNARLRCPDKREMRKNTSCGPPKK